MNEIDALWAACAASPDDSVARGAFADCLDDAGCPALAAALRGPAGAVFCRAAAEPPAGDFILRLYGMSAGELQTAVRERVSAGIETVLDTNTVSAAVAMTNASGWVVDDHEVFEGHGFDVDGFHARVRFVVSGRQNEDQPYSGNRVRGEAAVRVNSDGTTDYDVQHAEVEWDDE